MVYKLQSYKPHEMNRKAEFGVSETKRNPNTGANKMMFVKSFSLYYASVERGLSMESKLEGTRFEDTISIAIRHNTVVNDQLIVRINDVLYEIVKIQADDGNNYNAFDLIILKKKGR